jgi:ribonuclease Z
MFWGDLKPYIEKYSNVTFILFHFSLRYKNKEILNFFEEQNLKNVIPWIENEYIISEDLKNYY